MNKVEGVQPCRLPLLPSAPAASRLALLRQEREQRRRRARWLSSLLLAMGLAFVAQGFVREQASVREAAVKPRPADSKSSRPSQAQAASPTPVAVQANLQAPNRR